MNIIITPACKLTLALSIGTSMLLASGCSHDHSHDEHTHGGHSHGSGGHVHGSAENEPPAQSVTIWTEKTELFMEYEPFVVGRPSRFAAHLTTMHDFKAITSGVLSLSLELADGTVMRVRADAPSSPGIFRFSLSPEKPGPCKLSLTYNGQGIEDTIQAGASTVHASQLAVHAFADEQGEDGVAYTKEEQWKTDFATVEVTKRRLQPSVRSVGELSPVSGREARLAAPARGRISLARPTPMLGTAVKKGQLLATVSPYLDADGDRSTLDGEVRSAKAEHTAALSQLERVERLFAEQAVPERRVEDARARLSVAKAKLDSATGRLQQYTRGAAGVSTRGIGAFKLRSAIDGTLVEMNATSGDSVEEGQALFVVIDLSRVWLVARVFEPDIPKVESATSAWFNVEGYEQPFVVDANNGRLITVGRVIDPQSRTVPVVFEMENPNAALRIGQFADIYIATGEPREMRSIPSSALLEDGGKKIVFVQNEGETFQRRVVQTGIRSKEFVEILSGVELGERVVTKGAYEVRLAAASGAIPKHGHVH